jgi:hypothetical protein
MLELSTRLEKWFGWEGHAIERPASLSQLKRSSRQARLLAWLTSVVNVGCFCMMLYPVWWLILAVLAPLAADHHAPTYAVCWVLVGATLSFGASRVLEALSQVSERVSPAEMPLLHNITLQVLTWEHPEISQYVRAVNTEGRELTQSDYRFVTQWSQTQRAKQAQKQLRGQD